jgi:hypothetical protein
LSQPANVAADVATDVAVNDRAARQEDQPGRFANSLSAALK